MTNMIDKVAIAISSKTWATGADDTGDCCEWDDMPNRIKDIYRSAAVEAISAMREPDWSMIGAMKKEIGPLRMMYRAAIDAALGEYG